MVDETFIDEIFAEERSDIGDLFQSASARKPVAPTVAKNSKRPVETAAAQEGEILPPEAGAESTGTSVALLGEMFTPVAVIQDDKIRDSFIAHVKARLSGFKADLTTAKGREEMASMAYECNKAKAQVKKAVETMTEEWRIQTNKANAARKTLLDDLEAIRVEFRKPLSDWEQAEEDRVKAVNAFLGRVAGRNIVTTDETSADVAATIADLRVMLGEITPLTFQEREEYAREEVEATIERLELIHARLVREEADRAELARLRAADEERQRVEAEKAAAEAERLRIEAEEKARVEAAERAEREEAERLARIEQEAADKARREAQEAADRAAQEAAEKAREEQAAKDREYEAKLAELNRIANEERRQREEAEARAKAEAERIERERQEQERQAAAQKAADDKRQADQRHRASIMTAAKVALMEHASIDEDVAKRIVLAITANSIPAFSIRF